MSRVLNLLAVSCVGVASRSFVIQNDSWVKDGEIVQLRSGSMHYFRVPSAYWKDRITRLKAMGLNAISTYVAWNFHEETEGNYSFEGDHDLAEFLNVANDLDMMVLLRPGPYICGEWDFGGLPAWIMNHNVTLRTYEPNYIRVVDTWWKRLMGEVKPMLYSNGGPIVLLQIENEYGSYGNVQTNPLDLQYMQHLVNKTNSYLGEGAVILYTTDGGNDRSIGRGSLNGSAVVSVGDGHWACSSQAKYNPVGMSPCMNSETYTGWLTHWGEKIANKSGSDKGTGNAIQNGHSFNLYMAHGGSNFGFWSGANGGGKGFKPDITSYDYGAPVQENGDHGIGSNGVDMYSAILDSMKSHVSGETFPDEPAALPRKAYGRVVLSEMSPMLSDESLVVLDPSGAVAIESPVSMESLGQNYGFIFYTSDIAKNGTTLEIKDYPRDRAQVFVDGVYNGAIYRPEAAPFKLNEMASAGSKLGLLVENMGRLNFGHGLYDPKGIITDVLLDGNVQAFKNWQAFSLPLKYNQIAELQFSGISNCGSLPGPMFLRGAFEISGAPADTYLKMPGFNKGVMWVNGINIGRYWEAKGPQHAFYVPAPYLKTGSNEVVVLELDQGSQSCTVVFDDKPDWGNTVETCPIAPQEGDVLRMVPCEATMEEHQGWSQQSIGNATQLKLGDFCLILGAHKDAQSGQPSAQLAKCSADANLEMDGTRIRDTTTGLCLDITAHGKLPGSPLEWYKCSNDAKTNKNQQWSLQETPSHLFQIISAESGKCVSACTQEAHLLV